CWSTPATGRASRRRRSASSCVASLAAGTSAWSSSSSRTSGRSARSRSHGASASTGSRAATASHGSRPTSISLAAARSPRGSAPPIGGGEQEVVVLDEITYPVNYGWLPVDDVVSAISGRPEHVNIVATGRNAPEQLVELADTVTEMRKVKHAFDRGIRARRGLDF